MEKINYSFIILVNDALEAKRTIESILKQKYDLSRIEIILEDILEDEDFDNYIKGIDSCKIIHHNNEEMDEAKRYQLGLNSATGEFVTFINSSIWYEERNTLKMIDKYKSNNIITLNLRYYDADTEKFKKYQMQPSQVREINLLEEYSRAHLGFEAYFIKRIELKDYSFNTKINDDYKYQLIIDLLKKSPKYFFIGKSHIASTKAFETNTSKCSIQYQKDWYTESIEKFIVPMLKSYGKKIPLYIQEIALYLIYSKYNCNIYDRNKGVLSIDEFEEFNKSVTKALALIDNEILLRTEKQSSDELVKHQFTFQRWLLFWLHENKLLASNIKKKVIVNDNYIAFSYPDGKKLNINDATYESIDVHAINYKHGKLYFDCTTSLRDYMYPEDIDLEIMYNGKKIDIVRKEFYTLLKAFGKTLSRKYAFSFEIEALPKDINNLEAYAKLGDKRIKLMFKYKHVQAKLSNSKRAFWAYKNFIAENKVYKIIIRKYNVFHHIKDEVLFDLSKLKNVKTKLRVMKLIALRMLYYITKPFYKNKHIWLTWDKLYKAGDNGEYIYQYGLKHNKNIYYIIKKDAPDYERLVKQNKKHIIVYNSLKSKLLSLHTEAILKTHANAISYCGFEGISRNFVCGLYNAEIIEIQHGLTIQKIAQYQNRLFDNIKHYCCTSQYEVDNILHELYDFEPSQITLTGAPRYDGLKNNDKKIILITPTWRRNVVNSSVAHIKKKHNDNFKNSEYFKIYDSLINNEKLINKAKEKGYKIIYLLHPAMSGQLEDFDQNDFVKIVPATGDVNYEKILTESSLMVTDYSGVQFDFAYQRKPILYYHPDALPPHYDAGGLEYETMGFGPVCKDEKTLVDELCRAMDKKCVIDDKYKKRADKFFAYDDHNNCKRIIETVDKYLADIEE